MRVFDNQFLASLKYSSVNSLIKRGHLNLHSSFDEKVQRLFIHLQQGSYVKPHFHELRHQWEMFVVIEGLIEVVFFSSKGVEVKKLLVGETQNCRAIEIHPNEIHSVECLSSSALILEIKEGPFSPETVKFWLVLASFQNYFHIHFFVSRITTDSVVSKK